MSRIKWETPVDRPYESGLDRCVFYPSEGKAVPWNGMVSVVTNENIEAPTPIYLDGIKTFDIPVTREATLTMSCYTYPDEFMEYDGYTELATGLYIGEGMPKPFGLSYRTLVGDKGHYRLHLLYGMTATPASTTHGTLAAQPEASLLSWKLQGVPMNVPSRRPTSYITIDSWRVSPVLLRMIEQRLYGNEDNEPDLPTPTEIQFYAGDANPVTVTALPDMEWSLLAPNNMLTINDDGTWTFVGPTAKILSDGAFTVKSENE